MNLCKRFSDQAILQNINLNISKGEIHGIIGSSGVGKSTLLRCINGLESYQSGSIMVEGVEVSALHSKDLRALRKKIGMVFQDFALLESKTAYDNILLPLQCWDIDSSLRHKRVEDLLALVGLSEKAHAYPKALSGGQKQRVAIARTLALNPSIILCDEATSALDPQTAKSILKLLKEINQQTQITIVMVAHQLEVIKEVCHRLSIIENKTITLTDELENILLTEPELYRKLIGLTPIAVPKGQACLKIVFADGVEKSVFLSVLAQELQLTFHIIHAKTEHCEGKQIVIFYISFSKLELARVANFLMTKRIDFLQVEPVTVKEGVEYVF